MRIAFVYDAVYPWVAGGGERRIHELGQQLAERHDVHVVGWQWWDGPTQLHQGGVTFHGVGRPPRLYGADGKRTVREALSFSMRVLPVLVRHRWDVVDCSATPYLPLYATWLATRLTRTRLVVTWHEFWGPHWSEYLPRRPVVARVARFLESGGRRLGDRVVAVSDFTAAAMGMTDDPRLAVVPNGVSVEAIATSAPADERTDLLFIGRLIDEKRVDLLLGAMQLVSSRFPAISLAVVGDGPQLPALERQAVQLGIADRVQFRGRVAAAQVPRLLRATRILVLPSVREGYGIVVAEGQAAGAVPIVVRSPFSAAPDLVRHGIDGLVADPTAASLAEAIGSVMGDERKLSDLSAAAAMVGAARDWVQVASRMEPVYQPGSARKPAAQPNRGFRWL